MSRTLLTFLVLAALIGSLVRCQGSDLTAPSRDLGPAGTGTGANPGPNATAVLSGGLISTAQPGVLAVTGSTASLPVLVDGVPVGQTDELGFAHVHVRARPDSSFDVSLDTSANDKLSPTNPSQRFELDANDQVFVFDTTFDTPRPAKQRRGKRRARGT